MDFLALEERAQGMVHLILDLIGSNRFNKMKLNLFSIFPSLDSLLSLRIGVKIEMSVNNIS